MRNLAAEIIAVQPTREQLLRLKRRRTFAQGVLDILERDLGALVKELLKHVETIAGLRKQLHEKLNEARARFVEAKMLVSYGKLKQLQWIAEDRLSVEIGKGEISGVSVDLFRLAELVGGMFRESCGFVDGVSKIDELGAAVKEALEAAVGLAEAEGIVATLIEAISTIKRRMNFIQHKIIPQLDATIRYVELILEETEREDSIRIRVLQRKRKQR